LAAVELVEAAGLTLDPWQADVLTKSLRRRDGRWAAFEVGLCVPRQNGKTELLLARELAGLFILGEKLLIHSAHLADTAKEAFRRLEQTLEANEWLSREVKHVWRTNGHEAIELKSGARIRFRTRTKGGGRGFSADWVGFDEAMVLPETSLGAIMPVLSAMPDPQAWFTGSAVDQLIHEDGVVFSRLRARGQAGDDPSLLWMEWSAPFTDPAAVPAEAASDPEIIAMANPALSIRIHLDYVEKERLALDPRTNAVERLNVGDWFDLSADGSVISAAKWSALTDPKSEIQGPLWFAFDVDPLRTSASIAVAGKRPDGRSHVEVVEMKKGVGWLLQRLPELHAKHHPARIVCATTSPAASLLPDLAQAGVYVEPCNSSEEADACGILFDAVEAASVAHMGEQEVASALRGAKKRPLGDRWAWSRKNSTVNITPLVAATLALWASVTSPPGEVWTTAW
jgi:phage terminase large subunit-like protein